MLYNDGRYEKLDEKDVELSDGEENSGCEKPTNQNSAFGKPSLDTDDVIGNSQSKVRSSQELEDEECVIEDFDD